MIKKLQHRFIFITMSCIGLVFALLLLAINIFMIIFTFQKGYNILDVYSKHISSANVSAPTEHPGINPFDNMRLFSVFFDTEGNLLQVSSPENHELSKEDKETLANEVLLLSKERGSYSNYLYTVKNTEKETVVCFFNFAPERAMTTRLLQTCALFSFIGVLILSIPIYFLSKWIIRPVQLAFDKQKQFIGDASHELKTPLTIIMANAEVLETSLPENKWLLHILEQGERMKQLINSLLTIAKLDAGQTITPFTDFDLSKTVQNSALTFESLAYEYQKQYQIHVEEHLSLLGNEEQIRQLVTILLDNAFKYSDENGHVSVSLTKHGNKKVLQVSNTGKSIPAKDQKHIFERFYRSDASRSRESGSYGLGLSIAHSIVALHKGKISVQSKDGHTVFTVQL